jgi:hypothetical protein
MYRRADSTLKNTPSDTAGAAIFNLTIAGFPYLVLKNLPLLIVPGRLSKKTGV